MFYILNTNHKTFQRPPQKIYLRLKYCKHLNKYGLLQSNLLHQENIFKDHIQN